MHWFRVVLIKCLSCLSAHCSADVSHQPAFPLESKALPEEGTSATYHFNGFTPFVYHNIVSGVIHVCPDCQPQRLQVIALAETTDEREMLSTTNESEVDSAFNPGARELSGGMQQSINLKYHPVFNVWVQ